MNYQECLNWIHSRLKFGIKPGLERMLWMLNELGNPQNNLSAVHIVGTNGKGSTTSYLQHIFSQAGYHVGTFTSPYIVDFRERISIDGEMISEPDFVTLVEKVKPIVDALDKMPDFEAATEFEVITVLMFEYFGRQHPVDIAFIEAGMGGLYDSTNVFKALAVICPSIGLDHQAVLGETYKEIAAQKVGVLKEGVPFIYASEREDVVEVFEKNAQQNKSQTYRLNKDFHVTLHKGGFDYTSQTVRMTNVRLSMKGEHQVSNASLVITAALLLSEDYPKVDEKAIRQGLLQTKWAGRTELMAPNVMIDGAHNNESITALVDVLKSYKDKNIHILLAAINTKPVDSMLSILSQVAPVQVTSFDYPTALNLTDYPKGYHRVEKWQDWLDEIDEQSEKDFYIITGSLYFISQVRQELLSRQPRQNKEK